MTIVNKTNPWWVCKKAPARSGYTKHPAVVDGEAINTLSCSGIPLTMYIQRAECYYLYIYNIIGKVHLWAAILRVRLSIMWLVVFHSKLPGDQWLIGNHLHENCVRVWTQRGKWNGIKPLGLGEALKLILFKGSVSAGVCDLCHVSEASQSKGLSVSHLDNWQIWTQWLALLSSCIATYTLT